MKDLQPFSPLPVSTFHSPAPSSTTRRYRIIIHLHGCCCALSLSYSSSSSSSSSLSRALAFSSYYFPSPLITSPGPLPSLFSYLPPGWNLVPILSIIIFYTFSFFDLPLLIAF
ncbi:uncharacterized protein BO87DRAFT_60900 [Aspergillus neoniger CBS 115656]|uniref:Uncharacterized protein n=1 Tax=Aspergillus neoniger (strain CBS 115656) TaxID=1448310 RepID=A0A318ZCQ9_ASPNB|nr:hypothetical protein BO87DRAFT_60900 [Aspergillus neoniger CBS 115656]PYH34032.1 hypothetical protein BO87DRAFT_60900 [Aspergillus neoniger CBS 115656]